MSELYKVLEKIKNEIGASEFSFVSVPLALQQNDDRNAIVVHYYFPHEFFLTLGEDGPASIVKWSRQVMGKLCPLLAGILSQTNIAGITFNFHQNTNDKVAGLFIRSMCKIEDLSKVDKSSKIEEIADILEETSHQDEILKYLGYKGAN